MNSHAPHTASEDEALEALVDALASAWQGGPALASATWAPLLNSEAQAQRVQEGLAQRLGWRQAGERQSWKSGGPGRHSPLQHALLPPAGVRHAAQGPLNFADLCLRHAGAEAEIALRLAQDLSAEALEGMEPAAAHRWIDAMCVAIELVDSRWQEAGAAPALLRQADCLSHAALALGEWQPYRPLDWSAQHCELQVNAETPLRACGSHSLGDPAWGWLAWLQHACQGGQVLPAGSVVTTGAWLVQSGLKPGDRVHAAFTGLGRVSLSL